jgi:hypothetical protein
MVTNLLAANPEEMRRLQSQGDVTLAQLDRAKECTVHPIPGAGRHLLQLTTPRDCWAEFLDAFSKLFQFG